MIRRLGLAETVVAWDEDASDWAAQCNKKAVLSSVRVESAW